MGINSAISLFTVLFCFVCFELILRLLFPYGQLLYTGYRFSPSLLWIQKPNAQYTYRRQEFETQITYNSAGLRDYEYTLEKPEGSFRIAVLGDSFTEAREVPLASSYPKLLEKRLNASLSRQKYEVINFGAVRYGTDQYLIRLKEQALTYKPDLILVGIYENDFVDNLKGLVTLDPTQDSLVYPMLSPRQHFFLKLRYYYIGGTLYSIEFLVRRFVQLQSLIRSYRNSSAPQRSSHQAHKTPEYSPLPDNLQIYLRHLTPQAEQMYRLQEALLTEIYNVGTRHRAQTVFLMFPAKFQIYAQERQHIEDHYNITSAHYDIDRPQQELAILAQNLQIPFIDMLPRFHHLTSMGARLYFVIDGHINRSGHEAVSDAIFETFASKNLLP